MDEVIIINAIDGTGLKSLKNSSNQTKKSSARKTAQAILEPDVVTLSRDRKGYEDDDDEAVSSY